MCHTVSLAIFGSGAITRIGSARSTHSHNNHRSPNASLKVSNNDVAGIDANSGPSGPISGSGNSLFPLPPPAEACLLRARIVIVAAAFLNPPTPDPVDEVKSEVNIGANSAFGEFCGCCPNGIAAVMIDPNNGSVRIVPG